MPAAEETPHIGKIQLGYPSSNGDNWQFNVRPAEVLDAAGVEIISGPSRGNVVLDSSKEAISSPVSAPVRWLLDKLCSLDD